MQAYPPSPEREPMQECVREDSIEASGSIPGGRNVPPVSGLVPGPGADLTWNYPPSPPSTPPLLGGAVSAQQAPNHQRRNGGRVDASEAGGGAEASQANAEGLNAAEVFEHAEALVEAQQYPQAAVLFRRVLASLQRSQNAQLAGVEAEVWAHLGVTMQSLDDIEAAIDSYRHAVALDPQLHVCFANLATLHMYLGDIPQAQADIARALAGAPSNQAYLEIQEQLCEAAGSQRSVQR